MWRGGGNEGSPKRHWLILSVARGGRPHLSVGIHVRMHEGGFYRVKGGRHGKLRIHSAYIRTVKNVGFFSWTAKRRIMFPTLRGPVKGAGRDGDRERATVSRWVLSPGKGS